MLSFQFGNWSSYHPRLLGERRLISHDYHYCILNYLRTPPMPTAPILSGIGSQTRHLARRAKCGLFQAAAAELKHIQSEKRATSAPAPPDNAAQPGTVPTKDTPEHWGQAPVTLPARSADNAAQPGTVPTKGTHRTLGTGGGDSPPPDLPDNAGGGTRTTPDSAAQVRGLRGISAHAACGRCGAPWWI